MLLQSLLRPVLTPIMRGIFDPAQSVSAAWSPLSLWPDGINSPGMWSSPQALTSEWQDYTGTTPVVTPGTVADTSNPVGLALDIRAGATVLTDPGNHMLQSTSSARPLASAYDGQTLGPGDTYDSAGYPVFQLYDGVDDLIATAAFTAGTLTSSMDCLIAVRRDAGTLAMAGLINQPQNVFFGIYVQGDNSTSTHSGCGSPVPYINGVQLAGGTGATRGALYSALTTGEWHILEYRGLDLSAWTRAAFGEWGGGVAFNGANGGILLFESPADPTERDNARAWLAAKVGVTLP